MPGDRLLKPPLPDSNIKMFIIFVTGSLRLLKSQMGLQNNYELVEMYTCSWGTVCRSGFDDTDAAVACRELGLGGNGTVTSGRSPGTGPVWASDFGCTGQEASLAQCPNATSTGTCSHNNDVIVTCVAAPQSSAGPTEPDRSEGTDSSSGSDSGGSSGASSSGALIGAIAGAVAGVGEDVSSHASIARVPCPMWKPM